MSTVAKEQEEVAVVKKRRRQRKRSRKSKGKLDGDGGSSSNKEARDRDESVDSSVSRSCHTLCSDELYLGESGQGEDVCGCKTKSSESHKRRRKRSRRRKRMGLDIFSCDALEDFASDHFFNTHAFGFVLPAFKVHEKCEHPLYAPFVDSSVEKSGSQPSEDIKSNTSSSNDAEACGGKPTSSAHGVVSDKGKGNRSKDITTSSLNDITVPVNYVEDVDVGDIIYFDLLTLRRSEPIVEKQKAKVFLKMKNIEDSTNPSILLRTDVCFDPLNPDTWCTKEGTLSKEPFMISFRELHQLRKIIVN